MWKYLEKLEATSQKYMVYILSYLIQDQLVNILNTISASKNNYIIFLNNIYLTLLAYIYDFIYKTCGTG